MNKKNLLLYSNYLTFPYINFTFLLILLLLTGCKANRGEIFLIPDGFTGKVRIEFNHPDGAKQIFEDHSYVFQIPKDGQLKSSHLNERCDNPIETRTFYLITASGERKRLATFSDPQLPQTMQEKNMIAIYNFKQEFGTKKYPPYSFMTGCWMTFFVGNYYDKQKSL